MPLINLWNVPLSGFSYHTQNSLPVPVFTSCTLLIYPISESTISTIISIPKQHFIPLESTLLLYNQETHVFLHLDTHSHIALWWLARLPLCLLIILQHIGDPVDDGEKNTGF